MPRIVYILDWFPVVSETFILREILALRRQGFEVYVMAINNAMKHQHLSKVVHPEAQNVMKEVYYFPSLGTEMALLEKFTLHFHFFLLNPMRYLRALVFSYKANKRTFWFFTLSVFYAAKLKRIGVDHIHAHYALDSCKFAMLTSMLTGVPYSFTIHAHDIFIPGATDLMEEKFNNAKFVACISEYNKQHVLSNYPAINADGIEIIRCGIDVTRFVRGDEKKNDTFTIVSIGRLVEQKGYKYLINACRILKERQVFKFTCHIIGEGTRKGREEVVKLIQGSDVSEEVQLLGAMDETAILKALSTGDVFVLPCAVEKSGMRDGIPVALMEAMAMEVPVISTNVSGIPELVKKGGGIVVEPEDANSLATAIENVFRLTEGQRKEIGKAARRVIEREFNLDTEVQKLAKLFIA